VIDRMDHLVLAVRSLEATLSFYKRVSGFARAVRPGAPASLKFGRQKINVHEADHTFEPKAANSNPGAGDFCLITSRLIAEAISDLNDRGAMTQLGPASRYGAQAAMIRSTSAIRTPTSSR